MALEYEEIDLGQVDGINGTNGKEVELQLTATHIQWRYKGASTWINLVALSTITGPQGLQGVAGKKLMIQVSGGFIQYKYESDTTWVNLIALYSITGATGPVGPALSFKVGTVTTLPAGSTATVTATVANNLITLNLGIPQGIAGVAGKDGNAKIANNLTTTDVTYALSAPQGKVLKEITDDIIAGRKTVPWSGVSSKPTTFAPIVGETPSTAYAGDKGKTITDAVNNIIKGITKVPKANSGDMLRTFDCSSVWHDDRLLYVHEVSDGKYELYVQEPTRVCKVGTDYTKSIQGSVITSLTHVAKILDGVSADAATAFLSVNVGSVYDGCVAIVTVYRQAGTPYAQIKGICSGLVVNGILPIEIYGYGFIPQHSMAVNIMLARLGG